MKVSKKHLATGMLAIGLITTAGAGVTAASTDSERNGEGVFYAEELLLKCPTKYEEAVPKQASDN